jgi:catechol 1,2-dioxygenase/hydroxyquinol 1,2-dioxygenase
MQDLTVNTITDVVLDQMASTPDARLKEIMASAVRHLHAFARETNLTPAEWLMGIDFMTKVGQMCTPERQEFILLSDTVGLSALVNLMHDRTALEESTHTSLLGPFFRQNAPKLPPGGQIAKDTSAGEIVLWGRVTSIKGEPLAGAEVAIWQTGSNGLYDIQTSATDMDCRGVFTTDAGGNYLIKTVSPIGYSIPMDGPVGKLVMKQGRHGMRPAHIHMLIGAAGYRELVTALYLAGDPHLADDTVFGVSGELVAHPKRDEPGCPIRGLPSVRFDFTLSRESDADRRTGRVGADPAQITRAAE